MRFVAAALSGIALGAGAFWLLAWVETISRLHGLGLSLTFGGELFAGTDWLNYVIWGTVLVFAAAISALVSAYLATKITRHVRVVFFIAAAFTVLVFVLAGSIRTTGTLEALRSTGELSVAAVSNAGAASVATYVVLGLFLGASVAAALNRISPTPRNESPV